MAENRFDESDAPYQADFPGDREATRRSQQQTRSNGRKHHDTGPPLEPVQPAKTYADPLSPAFSEKLEAIKVKLVSGEPMSDEDIEVVTQHGALDLLTSKRPAVRLQALRLLQDQRSKRLASKQPEAPTDAQAGTAPASGLNTP